MKKSSLTAAIFLAALAITTQLAHAETAAQLQTTIQGYSSGTGSLSAAISGNTVTVTGTKTGATTTLTLNVDNGVTVNWTASLAGNTARGTDTPLISKSGTGIFAVQSGKIEQTGVNAIAIYNNGTGTVNISGGTVSATSDEAVYNNSTGTVNISGGTVSCTGGTYAVRNNSTGTVNISGGTVSTTGNYYTIANNSTGKITVSGTAKVSSTASASTTIYLANSGTGTAARLEITGGTVENTAGGNAVYNYSTGGILLSGDPAITGTIMKSSTGTLSVNSSFNPTGSKTYALGFTNFSGAAVAGGASHLAKFTLASPSYNGVPLNLAASGSDLVISTTNGYAVERDGSTYTVTKGSGIIMRIQDAIDNIKTQAGSTACTIQFGDGSSELDIGTDYVEFGNGWGEITLTGKITSENTNSSLGTIYHNNTGSTTAHIISSADIKNTASNYGNAISNTPQYGKVSITGGTVSATGSSGRAVYNTSQYGTVSITGGTVSATGSSGSAVNSAFNTIGKITVSGTAKVTSANTTGGAISLGGGYTAYTDLQLEITGGTVENTAGGNAVYNSSSRGVKISGGVVKTTTGYAVYKNDVGTTTLTGGLAFAYGTADNNVIYGTYTNTSGNAVVLAWDGTAGNDYTAFTSNAIYKSAGTAQWLNKNGKAGIDYANGENTGFVALDVKVNKATPAAIFPAAAAITYGAALSTSALTGGTGAGTFAWQDGAVVPTVANSGYNVVFTPTDEENYETITQIVSLEVAKANPAYTAPTGLTAIYGQTLADVSLASFSGWSWMNASTLVGNAGVQTHKAKFTPTDVANYNVMENINVSIAVAKATGTFGTPAAVSTTYTTTLKLSDIDLPANYDWTDGTTALNAGNSQSFAATYTDPSGNYEAAVGSIAVNVEKAKIAKPAATTPSHTYSGAEQSAGIAANDAYTVTGDKQTNAGSHTATVALNDKTNYEWTDGTAIDLSLPWAIAKADPDMLGVSFPNQAVTHNGQAHSISISGTLPSGVTVSYTGNGKTDVGTHTVTATFAVADAANYNVPAPMTATLEINNKQTYDMSGIAFADKTVTYNGQPHSLAISGELPSGVTVSYEGNEKADVGTYTVTATFAVADPANYNTPAPMTATLTIEAGTPIRFTQTPMSNIRVQAIGNAIVLENLPKNAKVGVYNLQGKLVYSAYPENPQILRIGVQTKGIYIVKIGNQTMRIAVR